MSALSVQPPYPIFTDIDGQPLEDGYIWIGSANLDPQTNPINVYWDAALTILAPQPIRTLAGYPSRSGTPARMYVNSDYSIRVMNRNGSIVYSATSQTERIEASIVSITDPGNYYSSDNVNGALQEAGSGKIRGNPTQQHFSIGAIPRCTAGVFSLLNDAGHEPMNVTSVTQPDAFNIRINYVQTASKINSLVVGVDDALAPYGVICGGDVGTAYANILAFAPFSFYADHNTPNPFVVLNSLWQPSLGTGIVATKPDAATLRVVHTAAVNNDPVVVSMVAGSRLVTPVVSFSNSQIDIIMHGDASGYIAYDGAAWDQSFSNNITKPSMTWTAGNNLRIDHAIANTQDRVPVVTGHGGVYIAQIINIGSTYFEVAFYDFAGTKITVPNTSMQIWYRRNLLVPSVWPDSTIVSVKRGLCQVPSANFSGVAGNNLWVTGDMKI
jgi:hypothetical protein